MERVNIIIDTREQRPWSFDPMYADSHVDTLRTGDYALAGDTGFAIERKSLDDFLGTISTGWERFLREIGRMDHFAAKVVIVESDFDKCCFSANGGQINQPQHSHPMLTPQFICKRIAELTMMNVSILFAGTPDFAAALAIHIFRQRFKDLQNQTKTKTGNSNYGTEGKS